MEGDLLEHFLIAFCPIIFMADLFLQSTDGAKGNCVGHQGAAAGTRDLPSAGTHRDTSTDITSARQARCRTVCCQTPILMDTQEICGYTSE